VPNPGNHIDRMEILVPAPNVHRISDTKRRWRFAPRFRFLSVLVRRCDTTSRPIVTPLSTEHVRASSVDTVVELMPKTGGIVRRARSVWIAPIGIPVHRKAAGSIRLRIDVTELSVCRVTCRLRCALIRKVRVVDRRIRMHRTAGPTDHTYHQRDDDPRRQPYLASHSASAFRVSVMMSDRRNGRTNPPDSTRVYLRTAATVACKALPVVPR